jgi:hypothetical protein
VVWRVLESRLGFTADPAEWNGTEITFAISRQGSQTEVRFTHVGLTADIECYEECSNAWGYLVNSSLRTLIAEGTDRAAQAVVG